MTAMIEITDLRQTFFRADGSPVRTCGRSADEINGMPASAPDTSAVAQPDPAAVSAARQAGVPLPPNVAARVGEGSD